MVKTMEMKRDNPNAFNALATRIKELEGKQGKVGWLQGEVYPETDMPVANIAAQNEFGNPGRSIPARPFMRPAIIENQKRWATLAAQGAKQILSGKATSEEVMEKLTEDAENAVRKNIATLTAPALSKITVGVRKYKAQGKKITGATIGEIARKLKDGTLDISGVSDKPLEDSGLMSFTLRHVVEDASTI